MMNPLMRKAVEERRLISFNYKGTKRTVEPHSLGRQTNGTDALCGWQLPGGSGQEFHLLRTHEFGLPHLLDEDSDELHLGNQNMVRRPMETIMSLVRRAAKFEIFSLFSNKHRTSNVVRS